MLLLIQGKAPASLKYHERKGDSFEHTKERNSAPCDHTALNSGYGQKGPIHCVNCTRMTQSFYQQNMPYYCNRIENITDISLRTKDHLRKTLKTHMTYCMLFGAWNIEIRPHLSQLTENQLKQLDTT